MIKGLDKELKDVAVDVKWQDITEGGMIPWAGNAHLYNTGDWRTMRPEWIVDKCKQCLLCVPVCPDTSITVDANSKREEFDFEHCKGCGVCVKVCPFKAIEIHPEDKH